MDVLFICTGNICRSPMAAALYKNHRPNSCGGGVESAGISGVDGHGAHPLAQEAMQRRGVDLSDHRARTVTPGLLTGFGLILAMETVHRSWIETRMPAIQGRVYLLGHWRNLEIADPVYGGPSEFEQAAVQIEQCLLDWAQRVPHCFSPVDAVEMLRKANPR